MPVKSAQNKEVEKKAQPKNKQEKRYVYLDEKVKDFLFSDVVHVRSGIRGMLFSFGKTHPENEKFTIIKEFLLPLDVAFNLMDIMKKQFIELEKKAVIQTEERAKKGKEK